MAEICVPSPVSAGLCAVSFYMVLQLLLGDLGAEIYSVILFSVNN